MEDEEAGIGIVIEVKYSENSNLEKECAEALAQIENLGYTARLEDDGIERIMRYGIACYKKRCRVMALPPVTGR